MIVSCQKSAATKPVRHSAKSQTAGNWVLVQLTRDELRYFSDEATTTDIPEVTHPESYEDLNEAECGPTKRAAFVLGGRNVPKGGLPFMAAFTHVSAQQGVQNSS